jgi:hypothetical protein
MKAIVVFETTDYTLLPTVRDCFEHTTKRWGWDLIVSPSLSDDTKNVWYQKFLLPRTHLVYDQILVLDGDMLIRADTPEPPDVSLAYVSIEQPHRVGLINMLRNQVGNWAVATNTALSPKTGGTMPNGGFQLYQPRAVVDVYDDMWRLAKKEKFPCGIAWNGDQGIMALKIWSGELNPRWLSSDWNYLCSEMRELWVNQSEYDAMMMAGPMKKRIMHAHIGAWASKAKRIEEWDWTRVP